MLLCECTGSWRAGKKRRFTDTERRFRVSSRMSFHWPSCSLCTPPPKSRMVPTNPIAWGAVHVNFLDFVELRTRKIMLSCVFVHWSVSLSLPLYLCLLICLAFVYLFVCSEDRQTDRHRHMSTSPSNIHHNTTPPSYINRSTVYFQHSVYNKRER